ncbi:hypothetical protein Pcinc_012389 [Petrolisthes cinctipes]|uniref:Uncharacterized protein n=1 Tax=Petrolisthes cinctipes TaxID=88211 RepID=A0AAE1G0Y5_PETCI|nr:hypothetical protein Pcinc_012389 [Petrolisthes cinctipes]
MQRDLDLFNSSVFISVNYVLFTTLVIIASSILYTELRVIGVKSIILTFLAFIVHIVALYLLHLDKEDTTTTQTKDDSQKDLPSSPQGNNNNKETNVEVATPLLNPRAPGSPLADLNLPNTMFPIKSNSCMSLISQNSISHHHNHHLHIDDEDNHVAVDDNRNECSQNMGNSNGCINLDSCPPTLLEQHMDSNECLEALRIMGAKDEESLLSVMLFTDVEVKVMVKDPIPAFLQTNSILRPHPCILTNKLHPQTPSLHSYKQTPSSDPIPAFLQTNSILRPHPCIPTNKLHPQTPSLHSYKQTPSSDSIPAFLQTNSILRPHPCIPTNKLHPQTPSLHSYK